MGFFRSASGPGMWPIVRDAFELQAPAPV